MTNGKLKIVSKAILLHSHIGTNILDLVCHDVLETKEGFTLGAGRVFGISEQQELVNIISNAHASKVEFLPSNVLVQSINLIIWWKPAHVNDIVIRSGDGFIRLKVHYPPLVFIAKGHGLRVAAMKINKRPTTTTSLYFAPVMCQGRDLSICTGNMKLPARPTISNTDAYEEFFFEGANTHLLAKTINGVETNEEFLAYWQANGDKPFDKKKLVHTHIALSSFVGDANKPNEEDEEDEY